MFSKGMVTLPPPTHPYLLPSIFENLLLQRWLPWHLDHSRCTEGNAHAAPTVPSFIISLSLCKDRHHNIIPVEETVLTVCGICALLTKLVPYLPKAAAHHRSIDTMEIIHTNNGIRETRWITPEHGVIAHDLMMELFQNIKDGDMVTVRIHW
jgi:hypothetical protein